ncbi:MAG: DUF115 domain-containing protein [Syntrophomonadaceae bacterium]|nr:DUF115 domain-containing protein [Syntrophomonadaceae bacterium]
MAFAENMEILKQAFPDVWQKLSGTEDKLINSSLVKVVPGKKNVPNLKIKKKLVHNQDDPVQEAENFIGNFKDVKLYTDIAFYGVGLGYHIMAFIKQYPDTPFAIYEPVPEVLYQFLCCVDLNDLPLHLLKNIYLESSMEDLNKSVSMIVRQTRRSILIIELPSYQQIFPQKRNTFFERFKELIEERQNLLATLAAFQKRWTINSINNLSCVLNSPNIVLNKKGYFSGIPAILAASGPSLPEEISELKTVKEKGLAYIFAVGTAVNTLIKHGIFPHAACTYDPSQENRIVFRSFSQQGIKSIPLIFGSTVGYETLEKYPGPKMHMLIDQDALAAYYLKPDTGDDLEVITDAASIAVIVLQLLYKLGFNPIIFSGLNLAYRDGKNYAAGSTFFPIEASKEELDSSVWIKDVNGGKVASSKSFNGMKRQIEFYLQQYNDVEVINTTRDGAHIEGSGFEPLQTLIRDRLHTRVVEDNWLKCTKNNYDMEYLMQKHNIMNDAFDRINILLQQCKNNLDKIKQTAESKDAKQIEQIYEQFNHSMEQLRQNLFFAILIEPMNRVEMQFLMLAVPDISKERNPVKKAQMMEKEFRPFLQGCENDIRIISPMFEKADESIRDKYTRYKIKRKLTGIKILLIEGEGVIDNGIIYYSAAGDEMKQFNFTDRGSILQLAEQGIITVLLNPEKDTVLEKAARKLGVDKTYGGNCAEWMENYGDSCKTGEVAYICSQMAGPESFNRIGVTFAVRDAPRSVRSKADHVLLTDGGEGVIQEIVDFIITDSDYN